MSPVLLAIAQLTVASFGCVSSAAASGHALHDMTLLNSHSSVIKPAASADPLIKKNLPRTADAIALTPAELRMSATTGPEPYRYSTRLQPARQAHDPEVKMHSRCRRSGPGSGIQPRLAVRGGSTSRAQRNPMLSFLFSGSFLLRFVARRFVALLFHAPPRI